MGKGAQRGHGGHGGDPHRHTSRKATECDSARFPTASCLLGIIAVASGTAGICWEVLGWIQGTVSWRVPTMVWSASKVTIACGIAVLAYDIAWVARHKIWAR